jgi:hypothetical protein
VTTANVEPGGFGCIESQLAANGPQVFAAANVLALIYKSDRDRRFRSPTH